MHLALELTKISLELIKVGVQIAVEVSKVRKELDAAKKDKELKTTAGNEYREALAALGPARIGRNENAKYGELNLTSLGIYYKGVFVDGELEGDGEMRLPGVHYLGQFAEGDPHGLGKMTYIDHNVTYVGNFNRFERQGFGQLTTAKGTVYSGMFENGNPVEGTIVLVSGTSFKGTLADWGPVEGHMIYASGIEYTGRFLNWQWQDDSGDARITFPKRSATTGKPYKALSYTGHFKECAYHGTGTMVWRTGKEWSGVWQENEMTSQGEWKRTENTTSI